MSLLSWFGFSQLSPPPSDDFWYGPAGHQTAAGISVDENVAMTLSTCWAALMLLGSAGGMLPLKLMRTNQAGGSRAANDDPRYALLHDAPNDDMTSMMFRSSRIIQQVARGNAFAEIERNRALQPIKLHPIHASRIPVRTNIVRKDGKLVYYINNDDGSKTPIPAADMLHIPSPISEDGIVGRGVVEHARLSIGFGIAVETQGAAYFGNSARPSVVIEGGTFKDKQDREEYRRMWNEVHGGPANNAKPALMPPGAKLHLLEWSAEDSQFLATRQHNVEEIARWFSVQPHLIGHLLRATHNNIEHQSLEFVKYSLMKWLVLWEQELNKKLLTVEERKTMYFLHVVEGLERADIQTRTTALAQQFFNGEITLNEWRALENRNPIGPLGDIHWIQSAMLPLEMAAKGPQVQPATPPAQDDEPPADNPTDDLASQVSTRVDALAASVESQNAAIGAAVSVADTVSGELASVRELAEQLKATQKQLAAAMLRDAWERLLSVEINGVKRAAEKRSRFEKWMGEVCAEHTDKLTKMLSRYMDSDKAAAAAKAHVDESTRQLAEAVKGLSPKATDAELSKAVEACVSKWHEERTVTL